MKIGGRRQIGWRPPPLARDDGGPADRRGVCDVYEVLPENDLQGIPCLAAGPEVKCKAVVDAMLVAGALKQGYTWLSRREAMSLQLFAIGGPDEGKAFILHTGPDLMLGRSQNAYYQLGDPRVSRNHCQVLREGDRVTVIDNGSSAGTLVNGQKVARRVLALGDVVQVGDTRLRLQVGEYGLDVALAHAAPPPAAATKAERGADPLDGAERAEVIAL